MNFVLPTEPNSTHRIRDLRKAKSRPSHQHAYYRPPAHEPQYPPQWNQSTVSLMTPPPAPAVNSYSPPPAYPRPHTQPHYPNHQIVQQHNWVSTTNLPEYTSFEPPFRHAQNTRGGVNTQDAIGDQLSEIIALIDEDSYQGLEREVVIAIPETPPPAYTFPSDQSTSGQRSLVPHIKPAKSSRQTPNRSVNVRTKLSYYSNSRLPASLPPFRVYISTYPLLCLAALCSANAYHYRQNAVNNEQLVAADTRIGSKAMVIKSVTCNDEKTLVFAIRGTSVLSLRDWNVNLNYMPESPAGFLDDEGNYCHSGFLRVAKAMVKPIAARLRQLLEENPNRLSYSLLITGHSAGGAVASLLYAHMLSEVVKSELTILADCFKRVHCVTFGAPPISLLPLKKPPNRERKLQKSLFHSFINEGDPVVRAEKSYIMSLVDLLTTTPVSASSLLPGQNNQPKPPSRPNGPDLCSTPMSMLRITNLGLFTNGPRKPKQKHSQQSLTLPPRHSHNQSHSATTSNKLTWTVPPGTLSNAGRLVVLRGPEPAPKGSASRVDLTKEFEEVGAYTVTDEEIRKVIFGDPLMHAMEVYRRRIEALAMKAVTGRDKFFK